MAVSRDRLTRRALLVGLAATPLAACAEGGLSGSLGLEPKLPRRLFRALRVDAAPMAKKGVPHWAARLAAAVKAAADPAFADLIDPRDRKAPVLTLEIDACDFPVWRALNEIPFGDFGADGHTDWIVGHVVFGAVRRRVAVSSEAGDAGAWYLPDIDQRRIDRVAAIFAAWARREFED